MKILVSHFGTSVKNEDLAGLMSPFGTVDRAEIVTDLFTGQSRGFGFVEMPDEAQAKEAIRALDHSEWQGKQITVQESKEPVHRGSYPVGKGMVRTFRFKKN
ncbi:MAG: RNA recognition motif domain-containing protein [Flavisolibacter sp.]|jgi:RNA recognition motif-containing protein